jgi:hypothetical protein
MAGHNHQAHPSLLAFSKIARKLTSEHPISLPSPSTIPGLQSCNGCTMHSTSPECPC